MSHLLVKRRPALIKDRLALSGVIFLCVLKVRKIHVWSIVTVGFSILDVQQKSCHSNKVRVRPVNLNRLILRPWTHFGTRPCPSLSLSESILHALSSSKPRFNKETSSANKDFGEIDITLTKESLNKPIIDFRLSLEITLKYV